MSETNGLIEKQKRVEELKEQVDEEKKNPSQILMELARSYIKEIFHDQFKKNYVVVEKDDGTKELIPLTKRGYFNSWLGEKYEEKYGDIVSISTISNVINIFVSKAANGIERYLFNRVCWNGDDICIDMSNECRKMVKISRHGWEIVAQSQILFRKEKHQRAMKIIKLDGGGDFNLIDPYIHARPSDKMLIKTWYLTGLIPDIDHALLSLYGEHGSAKSFILELGKKLIDPSITETLSLPKDLKELVQLCDHHWLVNLDNMSHISQEISDFLCKTITGLGASTRKLYSDDEDVIRSYRRSIGINGINNVVYKPDLLDRSIVIELPPFGDKEIKLKVELWKEFERDYNAIMNGAFDILAKAMKIKGKIAIGNIRMTDFARWGEAISQAMGNEPNKFLELYRKNIEKQELLGIEDSPIGPALLKLMETQPVWEGTTTRLFVELKPAYDAIVGGTQKSFPPDTIRLSNQLNKIKPNLRRLGIKVEKRESFGGTLKITNERCEKKAEAVCETRKVFPVFGVGEEERKKKIDWDNRKEGLKAGAIEAKKGEEK